MAVTRLKLPPAVARACLAILLAAAAPQAAAGDARPFLEVREKPLLEGFIHLPGLLVTEADTVILIAQSRLKRGDFDPSDIVVTRSTDQGVTWSEPLKIFDSGTTGRIGYSCVLVEDRTTTPRTVLAYYTVGPTPWKSDQLVWYGRRSTDEGATWSEPFPVGSDGDKESKPTNGGHGFQFPSGRIAIPGRGNLLVSDDGGRSFKTFGKAETVETKTVALVDENGKDRNAAYLITRRSTKYRVYGRGGEELVEEGDHGNTFTTLGRNPGLARYSAKGGPHGNVLLLSGIPEMKQRPFSITYSLDEGRSWSAPRQIDEAGWYSDLGVTRDGTIIAAYTVAFSRDLKIARFNLPWVLARDSDPAGPKHTP